MAEVRWTARARRNLKAIFDYVSQRSVVYASALGDRLIGATELLGDQPRMGRRVPEYDDEDTRELIVANYRIVYRVADDLVLVLAIVHGSRRLEGALLDPGDFQS